MPERLASVMAVWNADDGDAAFGAGSAEWTVFEFGERHERQHKSRYGGHAEAGGDEAGDRADVAGLDGVAWAGACLGEGPVEVLADARGAVEGDERLGREVGPGDLRDLGEGVAFREHA